MPLVGNVNTGEEIERAHIHYVYNMSIQNFNSLILMEFSAH